MYDLEQSVKNIALSIYFLRTNNNMSAKALGKIIGKAECTVTSWERLENRPSFEVMMKICNVFGCHIDDLMQPEICRNIFLSKVTS